MKGKHIKRKVKIVLSCKGKSGMGYNFMLRILYVQKLSGKIILTEAIKSVENI
jgi:hypothetical protein